MASIYQKLTFGVWADPRFILTTFDLTLGVVAYRRRTILVISHALKSYLMGLNKELGWVELSTRPLSAAASIASVVSNMWPNPMSATG